MPNTPSEASEAMAVCAWESGSIPNDLVFGHGYDFDSIELLAQKTHTPIGDFMIWPERGMWSLYGGVEGWFLRDLVTEGDAKQEVARLVITALQAENQRLTALVGEQRRALEAVPCKCVIQVDTACPGCGAFLKAVMNNGPLNDDQFDAIKAGDWFCFYCTSDQAKNGKRHFWDRDLPKKLLNQCARCAALALTPADALEREEARAEDAQRAYELLEHLGSWKTTGGMFMDLTNPEAAVQPVLDENARLRRLVKAAVPIVLLCKQGWTKDSVWAEQAFAAFDAARA